MHNTTHLCGQTEMSFFGSKIDINVEIKNFNVIASDGNGVDCTGCNLFREVVHSNGVQDMKIIIHRGTGPSYHAWIESKYNIEGILQDADRTYMKFCNQSCEDVYLFLGNYKLRMAPRGFKIIYDSDAGFMEHMCLPPAYVVSITSKTETCLPKSEFPGAGSSTSDNRSKTSSENTGISAQEERVGNLEKWHLAAYFHLPQKDAAKELNISLAVLKCSCQKYGIEIWPYQQIAYIDKKILKAEEKLRTSIKGRWRTLAKIGCLKGKRARIYDCSAP